MRAAVAAIQSSLQAHHLPEERAVLQMSGHYGTGAVVADLAGRCYVMGGKDSHLLERAEVQPRLHLPPAQAVTHPESGIVRARYDWPELPLGWKGKVVRVVVATHPASLEEESARSHRRWRCLRTVLERSAPGRLHRRRCRGARL